MVIQNNLSRVTLSSKFDPISFLSKITVFYLI